MKKETSFPAKVIILLAILGAAAITLWFLGKVTSVFVYFGIAAVISYLLNPLVEFMVKKRVPRGLSILAIFSAFIIGATVAILLIVPKLAEEARQLAAYVIAQAKGVDSNTVASLVDRLTAFLHKLGLSEKHIALMKDAAMKSDIAQNAAGSMQKIGVAAANKVVSSIGAFFSYIPGLVVIPVLVFYFLSGSHEMRAGFVKNLPPEWRPGANSLLDRLNKAIGGFIGGQVKLCVYIGILAWLSMALIARLPYSLIIGFIACVTEFIPYLGPILGMIMPLVIAAFIGWDKVILVAILFFIIQMIENNILCPRVMSSDVGMHPVIIIFILMAGGEAGGLPGMLIALPLAVILKAFYDHFYAEKHLKPSAQSSAPTGQGQAPPDHPQGT